MKFNNNLLVVVKGLGDNYFFVNKNVVTVFDDMVTTIKKVQKMNEYLYETACDEYATTDLSDEEIIYVMANEKLCAYR